MVTSLHRNKNKEKYSDKMYMKKNDEEKKITNERPC